MKRLVFLALALAACAREQQQREAETQAPPKYSFAQEMPETADGAAGSGCLADEGPLEDGVWFGIVAAWDDSGIDLDPACFFTGEGAAREAAARGDESPPPNDFFIVNDSKAVRRIPVDGAAKAVRVTHDSSGGIATEFTDFADLVANPGTYMMCPGEFCPVWLYVNDGAVTEVAMQYLP
jgi:hypothetical protein